MGFPSGAKRHFPSEFQLMLIKAFLSASTPIVVVDNVHVCTGKYQRTSLEDALPQLYHLEPNCKATPDFFLISLLILNVKLPLSYLIPPPQLLGALSLSVFAAQSRYPDIFPSSGICQHYTFTIFSNHFIYQNA